STFLSAHHRRLSVLHSFPTRRSSDLIVCSCEQTFYSVLAPVSRSYPKLTGRLPTCYSPIRRSFHKASPQMRICLASCARLACIRHAASVRPEPRSNSTKKFVKFMFLTPQKLLAYIRLTRLKKHYTFLTSISFDIYCLCSVFKEQTFASLKATSILYHAELSLSTL